MNISVFRASSGEQFSVASFDELRSLIRSGSVSKQDYYYFEGASEWASLSDFDAVKERLSPPPIEKGKEESPTLPLLVIGIGVLSFVVPLLCIAGCLIGFAIRENYTGYNRKLVNAGLLINQIVALIYLALMLLGGVLLLLPFFYL